MDVSTRCWLEIDLAAIANNARAITKKAGSGRSWLAVVKADGYGHGAVPVAKQALAHGAEWLAVASLEEALVLRAAGIHCEILLLGYFPAEYVAIALEEKLTLTVFDLESLNAYETAIPTGKQLAVHFKVDSGMGRMGFLEAEATAIFQTLKESTKLSPRGIYTHFASAAEDDAFSQLQIDSLKSVIKLAKDMGLSFPYVHSANSGGSFGDVPIFGNLLRIGIALYGLEPASTVQVREDFRAALSWKTVVAQIKELPAGHSVGYGRTYYTDSRQRIAILSVGYSDGYRRAPGAAQFVLLGGAKCPVIGRVSMEKTTILIPEKSQVQTGDEVLLLGQQGNHRVTAGMLAEWFGTIKDEVLTNISQRVPRRYLN